MGGLVGWVGGDSRPLPDESNTRTHLAPTHATRMFSSGVQADRRWPWRVERLDDDGHQGGGRAHGHAVDPSAARLEVSHESRRVPTMISIKLYYS